MGMNRSFPADLVEQAYHLARRERTRPKQASLRRAVSNAYYAIFHLLIRDAVARWRVASQRDLLARAFEHGRMKAAAMRAVNSRIEGSDPATMSRIRSVALVFCGAYDDRQVADYDNATTWTRTSAIDRIAAVKQAMEEWHEIRDTRLADDFLLSLFVKER